MIYLLHPRITELDSSVAGTFHAACDQELRRHSLIAPVDSLFQLHTVEPKSEDAVIFFNHDPALPYRPEILRVLEGYAKVFPVAASRELRMPPAAISKNQSFDVRHELDLRGLQEANAGTVAAVFARAVLASLQPTLSQFRMRLFLSHRRADGEDLASWFYQQLRQRAENGFQDLSDVVVGEDAQNVIESRLLQSDAVLFLDTPLAFESGWVAKELEMALSFNLPIVWISAGGEVSGQKLKVRPAAVPHLKQDPMMRDTNLVDEALNYAFSLARESGLRILDTVRRLRDISRRNGIDLVEQSQNKLLYTLRVPRSMFRYPQLPMTHLVQFYGRWPKPEDEQKLSEELAHFAEPPELALLLGPIPPQRMGNYAVTGNRASPQVVVDSGEEYVSTLERHMLQPSRSPKKGLIISGAFPENCEPEHQQDLIDAVHAFCRAVFDRGGIVIFGAHPLFAPLIFDMAKRRRPRDFRQAVHLYFSTHFRSIPKEYEENATVFQTDDVLKDRNRSLTRMRQAMINDPEAVGLVAIGGKHPREGMTVGVDEEMQLSATVGIPAFLIGSVQGRSSRRAADLCSQGWKERPNSLSVEHNEQLRTSLDYGTLADLVLDSLEI
jgi:hypothetical protein